MDNMKKKKSLIVRIKGEHGYLRDRRGELGEYGNFRYFRLTQTDDDDEDDSQTTLPLGNGDIYYAISSTH